MKHFADPPAHRSASAADTAPTRRNAARFFRGKGRRAQSELIPDATNRFCVRNGAIETERFCFKWFFPGATITEVPSPGFTLLTRGCGCPPETHSTQDVITIISANTCRKRVKPAAVSTVAVFLPATDAFQGFAGFVGSTEFSHQHRPFAIRC